MNILEIRHSIKLKDKCQIVLKNRSDIFKSRLIFHMLKNRYLKIILSLTLILFSDHSDAWHKLN